MKKTILFKEIKGSNYIKLFEQFIADSGRGYRVRKNGRKIRTSTLDTYTFVLKLLKEFSQKKKHTLKFFITYNTDQQKNQKIKQYYKQFYKEFTDFLYNDKDYYDNYVTLVIKTIRSFFNYLKTELNLSVGEYHKSFYFFYEDIPVITINPQDLNTLIFDQKLNDKLPDHMKKYKDIFVFGCSVALRQGDLMQLTQENLITTEDAVYLSVRTKKTETSTMIRLPKYCVAIIEKYKHQSDYLFPHVSNARLNKCFKELAKYLDLTQPLIKYRSKRGERHIVYKDKKNKTHFTLADHITTHTMRRTAITTMLNLGMDELAVRKISGHAANSKEFFKYVNLAQSYMDDQTSKVYKKIAELSA